MHLFRTVLPLLFIGGTLGLACTSRAQVPPPEQQITAAVTPLPDEMQDSVAVLGYDASGALVTLREGRNELICLADNPQDDRFHVACYHEALEPFMQRGRELRAEGLSGGAVDSVRQAEIASGALSMPSHPMSLYSLTGPVGSFDPETGTVSDATPLYVIYTPFATGEEVGLPTRPSGTMPWLMEAGKPWAHIMITSGGPSN